MSPSLQFSFFAFFFIVSSLPHPTRPSSSSTDAFIYGGCSQLKYAQGSPYESNLNSLLTSLVNSATFNSYNNFTIVGSSPQDVVYGLYQCRGDLSMPDCASCVARAVTQVGNLCLASTGGALQLQACSVKYDNTTFLGVEDKTVLLKKCGPSTGYNTEAISRRDAVLAGLGSGGGSYRVGGSGEVQGVVQCMGDLSGEECQDCLSEAIGRLKSDCGTAVSGDMFLAKCYARYTAGENSNSKAQRGKRFHHHGWWFLVSGFVALVVICDHSSYNDAEKTFAIIIGLLAGVALMIVFLTFIIKICQGGKGK